MLVTHTWLAGSPGSTKSAVLLGILSVTRISIPIERTPACVSARAEGEQGPACARDACPVCRGAEPFHPLLRMLGRGERRVPVSFSVADQDRPFGVLVVELDHDARALRYAP